MRLSPETCKSKAIANKKHNCCILLDLFHQYRVCVVPAEMRKPNNVVSYVSSSEKFISSVSIILVLAVELGLGEGQLQGDGGGRTLSPSADGDKMPKDKCSRFTIHRCHCY